MQQQAIGKGSEYIPTHILIYICICKFTCIYHNEINENPRYAFRSALRFALRSALRPAHRSARRSAPRSA